MDLALPIDRYFQIFNWDSYSILKGANGDYYFLKRWSQSTENEKLLSPVVRGFTKNLGKL